jgi:hypothetical protein
MLPLSPTSAHGAACRLICRIVHGGASTGTGPAHVWSVYRSRKNKIWIARCWCPSVSWISSHVKAVACIICVRESCGSIHDHPLSPLPERSLSRALRAYPLEQSPAFTPKRQRPDWTTTCRCLRSGGCRTRRLSTDACGSWSGDRGM